MKPYPIIKVNAVDGSKININDIPLTNIAKLEMKQLETTGFRYKHYQLTKGAIGCYFSHIKVWDAILKGSHDDVLIFEDDATPPPNCLKLIRSAMSNIPDDWDIVLFGKHCKDCEIKKNHLKVNRFILLHCYMIRKKGIRKIMDKNNIIPISQQLDAYISEISYDMKIYAPLHDIVMQSESRTDIQAPIVRSVQNDSRMSV
jgi:GR25 family glycosyltransferase involved in LPS biosynthesis